MNKTFIRRLARVRHTLIALMMQGALVNAAGLYFDATGKTHQGNPMLAPAVLECFGGISLAVAGTLMIAVWVADMATDLISELDFVAPQQPQLPDVQAHMRPHADLPPVA
jgi:hypothetical protein